MNDKVTKIGISTIIISEHYPQLYQNSQNSSLLSSSLSYPQPLILHRIFLSPFIKINSLSQFYLPIHPTQYQTIMPTVVSLLLLLALAAISAHSLNTNPRTNLTHRPFQLTYTSKLLVNADKASEQTKFIGKFFNSTEGVFMYSNIEENSSYVKVVSSDGRKFNYTKILTFELNLSDKLNLNQYTQSPMLYKYKGSFRKLEYEQITLLGGTYRVGELQAIYYQNKDCNSTITPLTYSVKFMSSKYMHLRSSEIELELTFNDKLSPFILNYVSLLVVNVVLMVILAWILIWNLTFIVKTNCTFIIYFWLKNYITILMDNEIFFTDMGFPLDTTPNTTMFFLYFGYIIAIIIVVYCHCLLSYNGYLQQAKYQVTENIADSIYLPVYITTALLIFWNNYVIVVVHTAFTLYAIARGFYKSKNDLQSQGRAVITALSMAYLLWQYIWDSRTLRTFPGFFDDQSISFISLINQRQLIILEINILLTMPVVTELLSQWVIDIYRNIRRVVEGERVEPIAEVNCESEQLSQIDQQ